MAETLPITIKVNNGLLDKFSKLKSVSNQLAAQFNFQTLTANWYGDEDDILIIELCLETPASFKLRQAELAQLSLKQFSVTDFSDDVINCVNKGDKQLLCTIAITNSELELLVLQPKLLVGFIEVKLRKVLNLIAQQQSLVSI
ncbi:MAG: hypothetical protein ACI9U5_000214 [Colwellia sp.]|jgi:hypothetical protein